MNEHLGMFLDAGNPFGWWPDAVAIVVAGLILAYVERNRRIQDSQQSKDRASIKTELSQFALRTEGEIEQLRVSIDREADLRREKDERLGRAVGKLREVFAHYCGKTGEKLPDFGDD